VNRETDSILNRTDSTNNQFVVGIAGGLCAQLENVHQHLSINQIYCFPNPQELGRYMETTESTNLFTPMTALSLAVRLFHEQPALTHTDLQVVVMMSGFDTAEKSGELMYVVHQTISKTAFYRFDTVTGEEIPHLLYQLSNQVQSDWKIKPVQTLAREVTGPLQELWIRECEAVFVDQEGMVRFETSKARPKGILSGSFNPLHEGHRSLWQLAREHLEGEVYYELPIWNADKPPLDFLSLFSRLQQFEDAPVLLTAAATFLAKARLTGPTTFIVGADTAERIVSPRFYGNSRQLMEQALSELLERECRFLVAPRKIDNRLMTADQFPVSKGLSALFEFWSPEEFRIDISSSELRMRSTQQPDPFSHLQ